MTSSTYVVHPSASGYSVYRVENGTEHWTADCRDVETAVTVAAALAGASGAKRAVAPDPAAEFGAALSLYTAAECAADRKGSSLSSAYQGGDEFMRQCVRVGKEFEAWACEHVDFDRLDECWPYFVEDRFGTAALAVAEDECSLSSLSTEHWPLIAKGLACPLLEPVAA